MRPPEDPPPNVSGELNEWLHAYRVLGIEEYSLSASSDPSALLEEFGNASVYSALADGFGVNAMYSSSVSEDSKLCSLESRPTFQTSRATLPLPPQSVTPDLDLEFDGARTLSYSLGLDNNPDYATSVPLSATHSPSFSFIEEHDPGVEILPASGCFEGSSLYFLESRATLQMPHTSSTTPSRATTRNLGLEGSFARPLRDACILNGEPSCATSASTSVTWPGDPNSVDEHGPQSEPEPPDPSRLAN